MYGRPDLWHRLMEKLTEVIVRYLREQIAAGTEAVQLFDSWLGLLAPDAFERFALPYTRRIFEELRGLAPTIHFSTGTSSLLESIATAGSDLVGVDWRVPLDQAWARIGHGRGIQGNLDPALLLAPFEVVEEAARDVLRRASGRPGHVFNLGHGVLPETDADQLARLVELVHRPTESTI
jgi:uroporphyrinogen decarboxylase